MRKFIVFMATIVQAADAPAKPWKANAELSFVSANGNTKATTISAKGKYNYDWTKDGLEIEAGAC